MFLFLNKIDLVSTTKGFAGAVVCHLSVVSITHYQVLDMADRKLDVRYKMEMVSQNG